ncbi:hypothetical protein THASP1DRAFT_27071 [Thamnocephalis sphaerospora]|uniref:Nudix hydrolase domain-containing protein n=1 Tax=Thamnocephalis sphaerospora TaxID=78915 RepID=A0A4P9XXH7_9FUNG|nr:hypothetical protein THASP1DRAFT_27071 [Thamnocephalis sphaerospora]|eukprot:RKP11153.1 hypothetical protein THASP1DRAFT_27071 [Thamnocephalis sphaerospora]
MQARPVINAAKMIRSPTEPSPVLRPSASIIIAAPLRGKPAPGQADYRILMLKRSSRGAFKNLHAFPGGVVDPIDKDPYWQSYLSATNASDVEAQVDLVYRVCALREAFEECGILLAESPLASSLTAEELREWSKKVYAAPNEMIQLCEQHQLRLGVSRLIPYQRWITPPQEPRRFDARFYIIALTEAEAERLGVFASVSDAGIDDPRAQAAAHHDGYEIVDSAWYRPEVALARYARRELEFILPQWCMLDTLRSVSFTQLGTFADMQTMPLYSPEFRIMGKDHQLIALLQGDRMHSASPGVKQQLRDDGIMEDVPDGPVHRVRFDLAGSIAYVTERICKLDESAASAAKL